MEGSFLMAKQWNFFKIKNEIEILGPLGKWHFWEIDHCFTLCHHGFLEMGHGCSQFLALLDKHAQNQTGG